MILYIIYVGKYINLLKYLNITLQTQNNSKLKMKKPQDSDIFGTKSLGYAPRITNQLDYDPNTKFQAAMDAQYQAYSRKIAPSSSTHSMNNSSVNFHNNINNNGNSGNLNTYVYAKVNEQAQFDQNYHRIRKDADMQSNIFYEPTSQLPNSRLTQRSRITQRHVPKHAYHVHSNNYNNTDQNQYHNQQQQQNEYNFGKKQTLGRQIKSMPENGTKFKGNSSNIFGYDQHTERNAVKNKVQKLIPHQMQWTDHDSIRYQHTGNNNGNGSKVMMGCEDVMESKSQIIDNINNNKNQISKKVQQVTREHELTKQNNSKSSNMLKKPASTTPIVQATSTAKPSTAKPTTGTNSTKTGEPVSKIPSKKQQNPKIVSQNPEHPTANKTQHSNPVQINILKGWSSSIMEQLSKWCRLNSTKIVSVNFEESGKGTLVLQRSKRWEAVTDWLRKDAKLKIRVMNTNDN